MTLDCHENGNVRKTPFQSDCFGAGFNFHIAPIQQYILNGIRTTSDKLVNSTTRKTGLFRYNSHFNGHTLRFHPQTYTLQLTSIQDNKELYMKLLFNTSFRLNGRTLGFHRQTKLESTKECQTKVLFDSFCLGYHT